MNEANVGGRNGVRMRAIFAVGLPLCQLRAIVSARARLLMSYRKTSLCPTRNGARATTSAAMLVEFIAVDCVFDERAVFQCVESRSVYCINRSKCMLGSEVI